MEDILIQYTITIWCIFLRCRDKDLRNNSVFLNIDSLNDNKHLIKGWSILYSTKFHYVHVSNVESTRLQ